MLVFINKKVNNAEIAELLNNLAENDVDLESSEVVNELDELIENLEFDRTKIKEKLISFTIMPKIKTVILVINIV